jgi:exodeoxyribonuclease V gamma subunit
MLKVFNSNRTEALVTALGDLLATPLASPLQPELVVVPTPAMAQWLRLRLADRFGVCANVEFLYPASFIWEIFRRVLGDGLPSAAPFSPEANTWRIYQALGTLPATPAQAPLRAYLSGGDARHRLQLASEVARCFDQYVVFRPDWIGEWEAGSHEHWQAAMWRRLVGGRRPLHWVHALQDFQRSMGAGQPPSLPERATLFAISALSPAYLEVVAQLAAHMEINALVLNPCRQYWGDIATPAAAAAGAGDANRNYLDTGHRLLASMGRAGRDHIDRLIEFAAQDADAFEPPTDTTLLALLQADMLDLQDRDGHTLPRLPIEVTDRSLQVHACHSPMREVEVLHDQLLAMFERWPDLQPAQVLIAVTDFDRYAPFIDAVFGAIDGPRRIPYNAISRVHLEREPLIEAFLAFLELPHSRLTAEQVLLPLDLPCVARRFDLAEEDVQRIRGWVAQAGIRWGWDAVHRGDHDLPMDNANSWVSGLDRLLLGYALPGDDMHLFGGVLPCDAVEGLAAGILGSLLRYLDTLGHWRRELARARDMQAWGEQLLAMIDDLFAFDHDPEAGELLQCLRDQVAALMRDAQAGDCDDGIEVEAVAWALRQRLSAASLRPASLRGGVCLADLGAVRAVPFEVICVLGLGDGAFPRTETRVDFDLLRAHWRRGDRSRRDDDRYLFLETVIAARRCLYLSYVGADQRSAAVLPPSVLIGELLDVVGRGFEMRDGSSLRAHLLTRHPLHAFSPLYFSGDPALFSYRQERCVAPSAIAAAGMPPLPGKPLPPPEETTLSPQQFAAFFCQPVRTLIEQRLGVRMREYAERIDEDEPFAHTRGQAEALRNRLTSFLLAGGDASQSYLVEAARGELPVGQVGRFVHARALHDAAMLVGTIRAEAQAPLRIVAIDLSIDDLRIVGSVEGVGASGLLHSRAVEEVDVWHRIRFWVLHLLLCIAEPTLPGLGRLCTLGGTFGFLRPANAADTLQALVALYRQGICEPLHFFPRSADAFMRAERSAGRTDPLAAARLVWEGSDRHKGEGADVYYRLAFPDRLPIDAEFVATTRQVMAPMLEATEPDA